MVMADASTLPSQSATEMEAPFQPSPKESTRCRSQSLSAHGSTQVETVPAAPEMSALSSASTTVHEISESQLPPPAAMVRVLHEAS